MKELTVVFNVSVTDEILETLAAAGVREYTVIPRCQGCGRVTGPRMDSHVWPGFNSLLLAVVEDAGPALRALQALRDGPAGAAGVYAYAKPVEAVLALPAGEDRSRADGRMR